VSEPIISEKRKTEFSAHNTILVAEDEEYNFLFIKEILSDLNCTIIHTKDGSETIDYVKQNKNVSLILMDIKMPGIRGDEAAEILKKWQPDIPIIAQTAYALENEQAKYEKLFDDYITKPINRNELIQKVMKYIEIEKPQP
jgi:CheY-like chemotaxis protein